MPFRPPEDEDSYTNSLELPWCMIFVSSVMQDLMFSSRLCRSLSSRIFNNRFPCFAGSSLSPGLSRPSSASGRHNVPRPKRRAPHHVTNHGGDGGPNLWPISSFCFWMRTYRQKGQSLKNLKLTPKPHTSGSEWKCHAPNFSMYK